MQTSSNKRSIFFYCYYNLCFEVKHGDKMLPINWIFVSQLCLLDEPVKFYQFFFLKILFDNMHL